jgi:signal transduction histidine kinase/HAMP domain-containing protein
MTRVRHLAFLLISSSILFFSSFQVTGQQKAWAEVMKAVQEDIARAEVQKKAGDIKEATRYINNAAMMLWEIKEYKGAIQYMNESIELNKQIHNLSGISKLQSNLGMIYADMGEYEKSLSYFQLSLDYRLKEGEKSEIISTYINKSVVLNNLKKYTEAATTLEEALRLATEMNDAVQMKSCYGMLAETYEKAGNTERTKHYFDLYRTFHEMIQRSKMNDARKETEAARTQALQAELEKKEKELQLISAQKELYATESELKDMTQEVRTLLETKTRQELAMGLLEKEVEADQLKIAEADARSDKQKILTGIIGLSFLAALAVVFLLYRNYKFKQKVNRQLAEQNEEIKAMNENLDQEVNRRTAELRAALVDLERRNKDLDQFSHIISHNLRAPVASILGLHKILNKEDVADPINIEIFQRLASNVSVLDNVVKDLNLILQVQDHKGIPKEMLSIRSVIDNAASLLQDEVKKSGMKLVMDDTAPKVLGIKTYLESVFYNLLSNAIKYCAPGRTPQVKIKCTQQEGAYRLEVSDNGLGIAEENFEKIFEPYKRLSIEGEGKGLGLYLVKSQIESMGGKISVTSAPGAGSCFTITLPVK